MNALRRHYLDSFFDSPDDSPCIGERLALPAANDPEAGIEVTYLDVEFVELSAGASTRQFWQWGPL